MSEAAGEFDLAIVGLACRFPGAPEPASFWRNLVAGVESIASLSDAELAAAGVPPELSARPGYVRRAARLAAPEEFDAAFFGCNPAEAAALDPQHRLLLELAHEALEDAGCDPDRIRPRRIGVFAGAALNSYFIERSQGASLTEHYIPTLLAADKDFLATRVSYLLGLTGPSLAVQTACSTGLAAVHLARQSLLGEECDLALAGAVAVRFPHGAGYLYEGSGVVSADGRVRPFGAGANGTVFGSGGGVVALKRLREAVAEGDRIYAVVKGSALNNDGADKAAYPAPSVAGQADAVVEALASAGLSAEDLSYVEAHGSGTPIGDRIEALALTQAFRQFTDRKACCALGSVKGNLGHLDAAAGMAGLIKTALALHHRRIPATLHADPPNPEIDFANSPFRLAARTEEWRAGAGPRRAGVMATGMGGTNAHVILEEAPVAPAPARADRLPELFVLSARSPEALEAAAGQLAAHVDAAADIQAADVAGTLQSGRRAFRFRRAAVASAANEGARLLRAGAIAGEPGPDGPPLPVFLLPGVGDQYPGMGRSLYQRFAPFREAFDEAAALLAPELGADPRALLHAGPPRPAGAAASVDLRLLLARDEGNTTDQGGQLHRTRFSQPLLFLTEYALARLWQAAGIQPGRIITHSLGEWVAACLSGVLSLADAARMVAIRARLVDELPEAALTAVMLPPEELTPLLPPEVFVALVNGPRLCVIAGKERAMISVRSDLAGRGITCRAVRGGHPFHTPLLAAIAEPFRAALRTVCFREAAIPFTSNVTGGWITKGEAADPEYWVRHACSPVRFDRVLERLWELPDPALIEVGPGRTLGVLALQHPGRGSRKPLSVPSLPAEYEPADEIARWLESAGRLWVRGLNLNWGCLRERPYRTVSLPTYPFQRQVHALPRAAARRPDVPMESWFHLPRWERRPLPAAVPLTGACLLIRAEMTLSGRGAELARSLQGQSLALRQETVGSDWRQVLRGMKDEIRRGLTILYAAGWEAASGQENPCDPDALEKLFYDPVELVRALAEIAPGANATLVLASRSGHDVIGSEQLAPSGAMPAALAQVLRREYPHLRIVALDLDEAAPADAIAAEAAAAGEAVLVARRGRSRWERTWRPESPPVSAPERRDASSLLRERGVYLITGGAGGIGREIAVFLARSCRARVVLASRRPDTLRGGALADTRRRIEEAGGEVEIEGLDVTDPVATANLVEEIRRRHGALHGVFHAAGVQRDGVLELKTRADLERTLAPKVAGTAALYGALGGAAPDFVVLFSSLSAPLGYHGQADYAAANAFLDGMAAWASARFPFPTLSINWPVWNGIGMAADRKQPVPSGIEPADALGALRSILAAGWTHVAVAPVPWSEAEAAANAVVTPAPVAPEPLPVTEPALDPPRDDLEAAVASLWSDALGVPVQGVHADFLALGGHSLLAMRIVARIRAIYEIDFTLRQFFAAPTVAGNAAAIREAVVADVEKLSDEELRPLPA